MTASSPGGSLIKYATPYSTLSVDNGAPFVLSYPKHSFAKTWRNIDALENYRLRLKPFVPFVPWYRASLMVVHDVIGNFRSHARGYTGCVQEHPTCQTPMTLRFARS